MPSKKRTSRLEEKLQKQAQKLKSQLEKELAPKRGSGEPLTLTCVSEELSPAQIAWQSKIHKEIKDATQKIDNAIKRTERKGTVFYKGDFVEVFQFTGEILEDPNTAASEKPPTYQLLVDSRIVVGTGSAGNPITVTPGGKQVSLPTNTSAAPPPLTLSTRATKKTTPTAVTSPTNPIENRPVTRTRNAEIAQPPPPPPPQLTPAIASGQPNLRPNELNAVGGLATGKPTSFVDLTMDDGRPAPDSREVSFNKLQGKTYPSLVVVARPYLHSKEAANIQDRSTLDAKVKSVLMYTPTKFTEWLIQQGLIKSEQLCILHPENRLKLGMYTDVAKFPYSGGYVWISDCCPQRFVSVFSGSIFEGATHPPSVILKLIYHWACRTNIQNIIQWVNVENIYVKGIFSWLRAVCSASLHKHFKPMGGKNKRIEIGVISLGTTSQDGNKRQVKVEVLGVLDPESRLIRLWAVEPLTDTDSRHYKRRFWKILEPLNTWVYSESIIVTDLTVDKNCLNVLGFQNVIQNPTSDSMKPGNHAVMDYLRRIVPRMFQNTLSLLSRHIIQQFLDELVWRECYGVTAAQAFNNIVIHLAEQTRQSSEPLNARLTKISTNPFKFWKTSANADAEATSDAQQPQQNANAAASMNAIGQRGKRGVKRTAPAILSSSKFMKKQPNQTVSTVIDLDEDNSGALESYYYGTIDGIETSTKQKIEINIKCCLCKSVFTNNIKLLDHLLAHAHNTNSAFTIQCRFCLAMLSNQENLIAHLNESHPRDTFLQNALICVICEVRFNSPLSLTKHMSMLHVAAELPYECGTCHHRTSSHRAAVEHFYNEHDGTAMLQCPFCLKSISVWNGGRAFTQNVTFFISHLQKHQKKGIAKKCSRCALWFVHKGALKEHQLRSHLSLSKRKGLRLWHPTSSKVIMARPKEYAKSQPVQTAPVKSRKIDNDNFDNLIFVIPEGLKCKECDIDIASDGHWPGVQSCHKCSYVTCCANAMNDHVISCKESVFGTITPAPLISDMHCVCGYKNNDGNILAKHLAICERKSAYPSVEIAKSAIATHSMLDVLGLVRRAEEPAAKDGEVDIEEFNDSAAKEEPSNKETSKPKENKAIDEKKDSETETNTSSIPAKNESNKEMGVDESNDDVTLIAPPVITMTID